MSARFRRTPGVQWKRVEGQVMILDDLEGEIVHFGGVGDRIWEAIDGKKAVAELARELGAEFDAPRDVLERDASAFLARLEKMELVERA